MNLDCNSCLAQGYEVSATVISNGESLCHAHWEEERDLAARKQQRAMADIGR